MKISENQFLELSKHLIGENISNVWRGAGSALFLEIGKVKNKSFTLRDGKRINYSQGIHTIGLGYGWRIERPKSISFGSWSTEEVIENRIAKLEDQLIEDISTEYRLPELKIKLSNKLWIQTFNIDVGQPEWYIRFFNDRKIYDLVSCKSGIIIKEQLSE